MKHLFIVNPVSGGSDKTEEVTAKVREIFRDRDDAYEIYVTKAPMDAPVKVREEAAKEDYLRVYACGGDGTFNECVCGGAMLPNVAICPFPTGTGNDFCRMFGEESSLYRDLNALVNGSEHLIDLIDCNGRYSANICSVGIDARIGCEVHTYSSLPLVGGASAYVISAAVNLFKGISRKMRVKCDDFIAEGPHTLVCACNGRYYGGGFNPSLDARPDDGKLDIFIVRKVSMFLFAALIGKYAKGAAASMPKYVTHMISDNVEIEFDEDNVINLDGEAMYGKKIRMQLVPKAMKLIVPVGMKFFEEQE